VRSHVLLLHDDAEIYSNNAEAEVELFEVVQFGVCRHVCWSGTTILLNIIKPFLRLWVDDRSDDVHGDSKTVNDDEVPRAKVPQ